ncbi:MAG: hypothetical protein ABEI52_12485 [Halobacteriaceae archaeon]
MANKKYRIETSVFRQFLENQSNMGEVNLGIALTNRNLASFTTLFTYDRADLTRLQEIGRVAEEYEDQTGSIPDSIEVGT